jgi:hypothetical protein
MNRVKCRKMVCGRVTGYFSDSETGLVSLSRAMTPERRGVRARAEAPKKETVS